MTEICRPPCDLTRKDNSFKMIVNFRNNSEDLPHFFLWKIQRFEKKILNYIKKLANSDFSMADLFTSKAVEYTGKLYYVLSTKEVGKESYDKS